MDPSLFVTAGTSLLGGVFQGIGANKRQKKAIAAQKEENALARQFNWDMAQWQNKVARENLEDERRYNLPSEQMSRLKEAGLNPDLFYGNGASGIVDPHVAPAADVASVAPADVASTIMNTPTAMESLMAGAMYSKTLAETKNIEADTGKKEGEKESLTIDNLTKAMTQGSTVELSDLSVEIAKSNLSLNDAQKNKLVSEINDINEHIKLTRAAISETMAKVQNLDTQTFATRVETMLSQKRFDVEVQDFQRRLKETDARVNLSSTEAKALLVTMFAKAANLDADTLLKRSNIQLTDAQKTQVEHYTNSIDVHRDAAVFKLSQDQKFDSVERVVSVANQATQSLYHISQIASDWIPSPAAIAKKALRGRR